MYIYNLIEDGIIIDKGTASYLANKLNVHKDTIANVCKKEKMLKKRYYVTRHKESTKKKYKVYRVKIVYEKLEEVDNATLEEIARKYYLSEDYIKKCIYKNKLLLGEYIIEK